MDQKYLSPLQETNDIKIVKLKLWNKQNSLIVPKIGNYIIARLEIVKQMLMFNILYDI